MAEKNDDIKNLFLNLGLNPSDYHEIRTAPSANATVSEAPRRWSLLQAAAAGKPASAAPAALPASLLGAMAAPPPQNLFAAPQALPKAAPEAAPASVRPASVSAQAAVDPETASRVTNSMAAALFAAATDIVRVEAGELPSVQLPPAAPAAAEPPPVPAPAASNPADDLRSLFQSVNEPQTVSVMPEPFDKSSLAGRRTDQLYGRTPAAATPAERAAASQVLAPSSRLISDDDAETRNEPPPPLSRLGPVPAPAPAPAPAFKPAAAGEGKLRFSSPAAEPAAASAHGDSLRDVFARLARENRR